MAKHTGIAIKKNKIKKRDKAKVAFRTSGILKFDMDTLIDEKNG